MVMCSALFDEMRIWLVTLSSIDEQEYEFDAKEISGKRRMEEFGLSSLGAAMRGSVSLRRTTQ